MLTILKISFFSRIFVWGNGIEDKGCMAPGSTAHGAELPYMIYH